jgi:F-type H+-transporting ATPase subunit epsilon
MNIFTLQLYDAMHSETLADVVSFAGEDASGSFGIMANHERFMTCLVFGMARFRTRDGRVQYLAMPGGVLYFIDNVLRISTHHYIIDTDYEQISTVLQNQLVEEEGRLLTLKKSLKNMETELFKRLWETGHTP